MSRSRNYERKVLVVGHRPYFELHMPDTHGTTLVHKLEFYHGVENRVFNVLETFKPDALFAFRPELLPLSVLLSFAGEKIGFSSKIFPKKTGSLVVGEEVHRAKFAFFDNSAVRRYGQLYHYDAASREFFDSVGIRFTDFPPYPLSQVLFEEQSCSRDIDVLFIGRVSPRRYEMLEPLKRKKIRFVSIDHGFFGEDLLALLRRSKIILNIHAENHVSFEPRTLIGAAVGAVVVSEPIPIPSWMKACPFIFTNDLGSNLMSRLDFALESYDEQLPRAESFRKDLELLCSANRFIDRCLSRSDRMSRHDVE